jgi:hypothetical protein
MQGSPVCRLLSPSDDMSRRCTAPLHHRCCLSPQQYGPPSRHPAAPRYSSARHPRQPHRHRRARCVRRCWPYHRRLQPVRGGSVSVLTRSQALERAAVPPTLGFRLEAWKCSTGRAHRPPAVIMCMTVGCSTCGAHPHASAGPTASISIGLDRRERGEEHIGVWKEAVKSTTMTTTA